MQAMNPGLSDRTESYIDDEAHEIVAGSIADAIARLGGTIDRGVVQAFLGSALGVWPTSVRRDLLATVHRERANGLWVGNS